MQDAYTAARPQFTWAGEPVEYGTDDWRAAVAEFNTRIPNWTERPVGWAATVNVADSDDYEELLSVEIVDDLAE